MSLEIILMDKKVTLEDVTKASTLSQVLKAIIEQHPKLLSDAGYVKMDTKSKKAIPYRLAFKAFDTEHQCPAYLVDGDAAISQYLSFAYKTNRLEFCLIDYTQQEKINLAVAKEANGRVIFDNPNGRGTAYLTPLTEKQKIYLEYQLVRPLITRVSETAVAASIFFIIKCILLYCDVRDLNSDVLSIRNLYQNGSSTRSIAPIIDRPIDEELALIWDLFHRVNSRSYINKNILSAALLEILHKIMQEFYLEKEVPLNILFGSDPKEDYPAVSWGNVFFKESSIKDKYPLPDEIIEKIFNWIGSAEEVQATLAPVNSKIKAQAHESTYRRLREKMSKDRVFYSVGLPLKFVYWRLHTKPSERDGFNESDVRKTFFDANLFTIKLFRTRYEAMMYAESLRPESDYTDYHNPYPTQPPVFTVSYKGNLHSLAKQQWLSKLILTKGLRNRLFFYEMVKEAVVYYTEVDKHAVTPLHAQMMVSRSAPCSYEKFHACTFHNLPKFKEMNLEGFKQAYYKKYNSETFKNPFVSIKTRFDKSEIKSMGEVYQHALSKPKSRTAQILLLEPSRFDFLDKPSEDEFQKQLKDFTGANWSKQQTTNWITEVTGISRVKSVITSLKAAYGDDVIIKKETAMSASNEDFIIYRLIFFPNPQSLASLIPRQLGK